VSHKKDRERAKMGMVFRGGQLVAADKLVKRVEKVLDNKAGVIDKLVNTWKKGMRKEIKKQGLSYLTGFNLEVQLKENMVEIERNFTLRTLAKSINLSESDVRQAMERTLVEMKNEYNV